MNVSVWNCDGQKQRGLISALGLKDDTRHCICAVGGGGKTTLIQALAMEWSQQVERVLCLTTTKIREPQYGVVIKEESLEKIEQQHGIVTVALQWNEEKLTSVSEAFQSILIQQYPIVLIEADGSKGLPSKVPNATEPVLPEETTTILAIQGIDAYHQPIQEVCHRPELVCQILNKTPEQRLTKEDMAELFLNENALRKSVGTRNYWTILQKVDNEERMEIAKEIAAVLKERGFHQILYTKREEEVAI